MSIEQLQKQNADLLLALQNVGKIVGGIKLVNTPPLAGNSADYSVRACGQALAVIDSQGVAFSNDGKEPDWSNYAALEREHLGDADKQTGIYHPDNQRRPTAANAGGLTTPQGMPEFIANLARSRAKYPRNGRMFDGLMGEVDELARAYKGDGDVRAEALDVAVCAFRIAAEGDAGGNANAMLAASPAAEKAGDLSPAPDRDPLFQQYEEYAAERKCKNIDITFAEWVAVKYPAGMRSALQTIHDIASGSTTANSLPNLARIAAAALAGDLYPKFNHPDDSAVDRFAAAMKAKMAEGRAKGRSGWDNEALCPAERLQAMLCDHVAKGDPVDVGNFAMMLFNRGHRSTAVGAGDLEQQIIAERIAITPEYEGGFHATIYGEEATPVKCGYGKTPSDAIQSARATANGAGGQNV